VQSILIKGTVSAYQSLEQGSDSALRGKSVDKNEASAPVERIKGRTSLSRFSWTIVRVCKTRENTIFFWVFVVGGGGGLVFGVFGVGVFLGGV